MNMLFKRYLHDIETENKESDIYKTFLNNMSDEYLKENSPKRMIIDYIAGMTDEYFLNLIQK